MQVGKGQRACARPDVLFSMAFKVYSTVSTRAVHASRPRGRRHERGHVSQVMHYNSIIRHFDNPELTPILRDLVIRSSLPLKAVEVDFGRSIPPGSAPAAS